MAREARSAAAEPEAQIGARLDQVRQQIAAACARAGRPESSVTLVAVSKLQPPSAIAAALRHGQHDFGENYAQELRDKIQVLAGSAPGPGIEPGPGIGAGPRWHFIGPLQRNKVRLVAGRAALIHSVDSPALVAAIAATLAPRPKGPVGIAGPQDCLIQVNIGRRDPQKSGCDEAALPALLDAFADPAGGARVRCVGLMCIPPAPTDGEVLDREARSAEVLDREARSAAVIDQARLCFRHLRQLFDEAGKTPRPNVDLRELSMGMSHDFVIAIEEGATLVRVGTAIFGARPPARSRIEL